MGDLHQAWMIVSKHDLYFNYMSQNQEMVKAPKIKCLNKIINFRGKKENSPEKNINGILYLSKGEQITNSIFSASPQLLTCSRRQSTYTFR
jgi:hypothetical protein